MRGKRILFCDANSRVRRSAQRALNATGSRVDTACHHDRICADASSPVHDLYMVGFERVHLSDRGFLAALDRIETHAPTSAVVLHTSCSLEDYIPLMAERPCLRHLIARSAGGLDHNELIITAEKLLRQDLFGLHKYLLWGVEPLTLRITASDHKQKYLDAVAGYASHLGCNPRSVEMIETVADELVTNAIYNAPRTPDGRARYAKLSRRERIILPEHEAGELQVACDGAFMALAQTDPFGSLTRETVVSYLNRCLVKGPRQISDASGGAGIGLFRVFQSLSKLVINIDPGNKTEIITLIDLRLSMKQFRTAGKSFHIFIAETALGKAQQERSEAVTGASM